MQVYCARPVKPIFTLLRFVTMTKIWESHKNCGKTGENTRLVRVDCECVRR